MPCVEWTEISRDGSNEEDVESTDLMVLDIVNVDDVDDVDDDDNAVDDDDDVDDNDVCLCTKWVSEYEEGESISEGELVNKSE